MSRRLLLAASGAGATIRPPEEPDPDPTGLPWDGSTNLVVDGNSISANFYTSIGTLDNHIMMYEPMLSSGATHSAYAESAHGWEQLIAGGAEVDAAWVEGATNVLFAWETTNSAWFGHTPTAIVEDIQAYVDARRAAHPGWRIIVGGTVPRLGSSGAETLNTTMETVDAHLAANHASMGIDGFVDFRTHPAFDHHGTTPEPFLAYLSFWEEKTAGNFIHLTDVGKVPIAQAVNAAIAALEP